MSEYLPQELSRLITRIAFLESMMRSVLTEIGRHQATFLEHPELLVPADIDEANYVLWDMPRIYEKVELEGYL